MVPGAIEEVVSGLSLLFLVSPSKPHTCPSAMVLMAEAETVATRAEATVTKEYCILIFVDFCGEKIWIA